MSQTMTLAERVVDYIGYSDAAMEKAAAFQRDAAEKQAAAEALIPRVVDVLIEHERIKPTERDKAAAALKDPVQVLAILEKVAGHRNRQEVSTLGQGVDGQTKTASANTQFDSLNSANVGGRTTRTKQSDVRFFAGLGIDPPTE